jgi:hypothetical protein
MTSAVSRLSILSAMLTCMTAPAAGEERSHHIPPSGVIGVDDNMLSPSFWISSTAHAQERLMSPAEIEAHNAQSLARDHNLVDLAAIEPTIRRATVVKWLTGLINPFGTPPVDAFGRVLTASTLTPIAANRDIEGIPAAQQARFGMAVRRALLRVYPTAIKAFPSADETDFDSFAAGVLFPGDAVVILHRSRDNQWLLVQTWQGPGWVRGTDIAEGSRRDVLAYARRTPYRVITADEVRTVFTPEAPDVSELQLDMGIRIPLASLSPGEPVNGASPYEAWTIELPARAPDGSLRFRAALLQKVRGSTNGYLPLTRANIIRQAFKFLGERYGWGHTFNGRDCSGFTSDVYRSFGLLMPPNSGAQGRSPALPHELFSAASSHGDRVKAVMAADVGDLLVVPGHVMMILGKVDGQPYVIQDVPFAIFRDQAGHLHKTKINEVGVTPLLPLLYTATQTYVDAMTSLVHVTARRRVVSNGRQS